MEKRRCHTDGHNWGEDVVVVVDGLVGTHTLEAVGDAVV